MSTNLVTSATGSGAHRWMNCPASVAMGLNFPKEPEKIYAIKGTGNHAIAAEILKRARELTEDTEYSIQVYVEKIWDDCDLNGIPRESVIVEERIQLLGSSGGLDAYAVHGKKGFIWDFKDGVGVKLQAQDNEQLAFYACGLKKKFPQLTSITCVLVQPRVNDLFDDTPSISSWYLPWQSIAAWERRIAEALKEVQKAERLRAGDWCQKSFCPALGGCPAQLAYAEAAQEEQKLLPAPKGEWLPESIPRLARILRMKKRVQMWFKKAEETLLLLAIEGRDIPGFELGRKKSHRKWAGLMEDEEIAELLVKEGISDPYKKKLISPAQAEKLLKKNKGKIKDLWEKPEGGYTLRMTGDDDSEEEDESEENSEE